MNNSAQVINTETNNPPSRLINKKTLSDISNGAISSSFTTFLTQPLQVVRTSMMVTYKNGKVSTMSDIIKTIFKQEGYKGFYRGFVPSIVKTTTGSAIYFGVLESTKDFLRAHHIEDKIKHKDNTYKHNMINFFSSAFARTVQSVLVNPILIIKTRFEVVGFNSYNSIFDAIIKIKREEGFLGYFQGLKQTLVKDVPHSAVFYSLYEIFKRVYKHYLGIHHLQLQATISSMSANVILVVLFNPIDVLRARIQYRHYSQNEHHNYKGILSGIIKIAKDDGIRGLTVGIVPRFIKKAIGSSIVWTSYETLKARAQRKRELEYEEKNNNNNNTNSDKK